MLTVRERIEKRPLKEMGTYCVMSKMSTVPKSNSS